MGLVAILTGLGLLQVLLWYFAIYALPAYVAFTIGWWALNDGAGIACVAVGLLAGAATFLAGRVGATSRHIAVRWLALILFVAPAMWAGYTIGFDISGSGIVPSPVWRYILAVGCAGVVGSRTVAQMIHPPTSQESH